jgi:phosphoribosylformylglycinamidine cyclo-ligase
VPLKAVAHITGGGLPGNVPRNLPDGTRAVIRGGSWEIPSIFGLIEREGAVAGDEMYRTFNMGLGLVLVLPATSAEAARAALARRGLASWVVGTIEAGTGEATCEVVG